MIYVIKIDHYLEQFPHGDNVPDRVGKLKQLVKKVCKEKSIKLITEEWCNDARESSLTGRTYTEDLAKELGVEYLFIDPERSERLALGIKIRSDIAKAHNIPYPNRLNTPEENARLEALINETDDAKGSDKKREEYWLNKIIGHNGIAMSTLLVCGYGHIDSFIALLRSKGYSATEIPIT
ncbi:MAG TPA: hypothetical protein VMV71_00800 [Candidatus Paceibacterota bacterium]|nr:hypothetical protein [Candidatus Paceibacterota bacterium]